MGFLDRTLGAVGLQRRAAQTDAEIMALLHGADSPRVSPSDALQSPMLAAVVRTISEAIAALPCHVYSRGPSGSKDRADHPADAVLARPNPWTGRAELLSALMVDVLTRDQAFAFVIRVRGKLKEIHRLAPDTVQVKLDENTAEPSYRVTAKNGSQKVYGWQDIVHITAPGSTPDKPLSLFNMANKAVALDLAMARYEHTVFTKGARPSGVLTIPKGTKPERKKEIHEVFSETFSSRGMGGTAVLDEGTDWKPLSLTMVESDFLALRKHAQAEISRIYRVPETLVGVTDRAVWRNIEELTDAFLSFGLLPWLEVIQTALSRALLTTKERETHFVEFTLDGFAKANLAARYAAYRQATGGAWKTPNEVRALDNLPPIEGGDKLILQAGQAPTTESDNDPNRTPAPEAGAADDEVRDGQ